MWIAQQNFGEKLAGGKKRDQDFGDARVLFEDRDKTLAIVFGKTLEVDQRTVWVGGGGQGSKQGI